MRTRYPPGYRPGQSRRRSPPSPRRRPQSPKERLALWRLDPRGGRRLTPFAYLAFSLTAVAVFAAALLPVLVDGPGNERLGWVAEDLAGQAAGTLATFPITWTVQFAFAPDGHEYYAADSSNVAERVKQDFLEGWRWYYAANGLPDSREAEQYFTGAYLQAIEYGLRYYAERHYYASWQVEQLEWVGPVEFSEDGSRATLTANLVGPFEIYQVDANQPGVRLQTITRSTWTMAVSLAWDTRLGRWLAYHDVSGEPLAGG